MRGGDVEGLEVVVLGFHLRAGFDRKAEALEDALDLPLNGGDGVDAAHAFVDTGQRGVEGARLGRFRLGRI